MKPAFDDQGGSGDNQHTVLNNGVRACIRRGSSCSTLKKVRRFHSEEHISSW
jgi:hypothetical protein